MTDALNAEKRRIAAAMVDMCASRGPDKTCCPSEVARVVADQLAEDPGAADWRAWMAPVHQTARHLHKQGRVRILQRGRLVSPDASITGPIRLQIGPNTPSDLT